MNAVQFGDCAATVMPFLQERISQVPTRISQSPEQEYKYVLALGSSTPLKVPVLRALNEVKRRGFFRKDMDMNKKTGLYVIVALLVIFGAYLVAPVSKKSVIVDASVEQTQITEVTYKGQDGKNAMELLKAGHQVETTHYDFGDMVNSIDGVKPDAQHFWSFYVNGQPATVGADAYQTKASDTISWKLDKIQ